MDANMRRAFWCRHRASGRHMMRFIGGVRYRCEACHYTFNHGER